MDKTTSLPSQLIDPNKKITIKLPPNIFVNIGGRAMPLQDVFGGVNELTEYAFSPLNGELSMLQQAISRLIPGKGAASSNTQQLSTISRSFRASLQLGLQDLNSISPLGALQYIQKNLAGQQINLDNYDIITRRNARVLVSPFMQGPKSFSTASKNGKLIYTVINTFEGQKNVQDADGDTIAFQAELQNRRSGTGFVAAAKFPVFGSTISESMNPTELLEFQERQLQGILGKSPINGPYAHLKRLGIVSAATVLGLEVKPGARNSPSEMIKQLGDLDPASLSTAAFDFITVNQMPYMPGGSGSKAFMQKLHKVIAGKVLEDPAQIGILKTKLSARERIQVEFFRATLGTLGGSANPRETLLAKVNQAISYANQSPEAGNLGISLMGIFSTESAIDGNADNVLDQLVDYGILEKGTYAPVQGLNHVQQNLRLTAAVRSLQGNTGTPEAQAALENLLKGKQNGAQDLIALQGLGVAVNTLGKTFLKDSLLENFDLLSLTRIAQGGKDGADLATGFLSQLETQTAAGKPYVRPQTKQLRRQSLKKNADLYNYLLGEGEENVFAFQRGNNIVHRSLLQLRTVGTDAQYASLGLHPETFGSKAVGFTGAGGSFNPIGGSLLNDSRHIETLVFTPLLEMDDQGKYSILVPGTRAHTERMIQESGLNLSSFKVRNSDRLLGQLADEFSVEAILSKSHIRRELAKISGQPEQYILNLAREAKAPEGAKAVEARQLLKGLVLQYDLAAEDSLGRTNKAPLSRAAMIFGEKLSGFGVSNVRAVLDGNRALITDAQVDRVLARYTIGLDFVPGGDEIATTETIAAFNKAFETINEAHPKLKLGSIYGGQVFTGGSSFNPSYVGLQTVLGDPNSAALRGPAIWKQTKQASNAVDLEDSFLIFNSINLEELMDGSEVKADIFGDAFDITKEVGVSSPEFTAYAERRVANQLENHRSYSKTPLRAGQEPIQVRNPQTGLLEEVYEKEMGNTITKVLFGSTGKLEAQELRNAFPENTKVQLMRGNQKTNNRWMTTTLGDIKEILPFIKLAVEDQNDINLTEKFKKVERLFQQRLLTLDDTEAFKKINQTLINEMSTLLEDLQTAQNYKLVVSRPNVSDQVAKPLLVLRGSQVGLAASTVSSETGLSREGQISDVYGGTQSKTFWMESIRDMIYQTLAKDGSPATFQEVTNLVYNQYEKYYTSLAETHGDIFAQASKMAFREFREGITNERQVRHAKAYNMGFAATSNAALQILQKNSNRSSDPLVALAQRATQNLFIGISRMG